MKMYTFAIYRHCENFWAFTRPRRDFGLILLIANIIIHKSFTGPTHLLLANVRVQSIGKYWGVWNYAKIGVVNDL